MNRRYFLFALIYFVALTVSAGQFSGRVVAVSDGDTITVLDLTNTEHKVRLVGIDAPEKAQAFGQASKKSLSDLIFNKNIEVFWDKRDRYQRILGKVFLSDKDICLEQIKRGMAWHYKKYQGEQSSEDRKSYSLAETNARSAHIGLWADESPVEPSDFRHKKSKGN
jgi:endonuclease YncB( thermonuclease family)